MHDDWIKLARQRLPKVKAQVSGHCGTEGDPNNRPVNPVCEAISKWRTLGSRDDQHSLRNPSDQNLKVQ